MNQQESIHKAANSNERPVSTEQLYTMFSYLCHKNLSLAQKFAQGINKALLENGILDLFHLSFISTKLILNQFTVQFSESVRCSNKANWKYFS